MSRTRNKGGALLAVLWLSAALAAIAFAVANTVRTETLRTSNEAEGVRTHYLAQGSVDRALLWVKWGMVDRYANPDGSPRYYQPPMPYLRFEYPSGVAVVEMIPESARINVNIAEPESIRRILLAVGADPEQAAMITQGILSWRTERPAMQQFLPRPQTFGQTQASFRETEELLLVNGMTPELFYGKFERDPQGRLFPRGGLRDCLTVYGNDSTVDPNTASPEMFLALGFTPPIVNQLVIARRVKPFKTIDELNAVTGGHPAGAKLRIGDGGVIWTVRATARLRLANGALSDLARTVAASVTFYPTDEEPPYRVLRWRDEPWTPSVPLPF